MGATNQRPAVVVEVRLAPPQAECPLAEGAFFAQIHSAADGITAYGAWGQAQAVGLWSDDVVTVSLCAARSKAHFERQRCSDFAELHLPWELAGEGLREGDERVLDLGLEPGTLHLGLEASPAEYREAFLRARELAKDPARPRLRVGLRRAPMPQERAPPALALLSMPGGGSEPESAGDVGAVPALASSTHPSGDSCGIDELSPEEMKRLFQLQVINQELRAELTPFGAGTQPEVEDQLKSHLACLRRSVAEGYELRAELQVVDREVASMSAGLTQQERLALATGASTPPGTAVQASPAGDNADWEEQAAEVMSEIQGVTQSNILLISHYDAQIKSLQGELLMARRRHSEAVGSPLSSPRGSVSSLLLGAAGEREAQRKLREQGEELQGLMGEISQLEAALAQDLSRRREADARTLQQLQLEHEVQVEEIGHLQQILQRQDAEEPMKPPSTGLLQVEVLQVEAQVSEMRRQGAEERAYAERHAAELRQEAACLQEELRDAEAAKLAAERELATLRQDGAHGGTGAAAAASAAAAAERASSEELYRKEALEKEVRRYHQRLEFCDQKISLMQDEADDLRQRASHVLRATPPEAPEHEGGGDHVAELQAIVQQRQEQVQLMKRTEDGLREELEEAQQALETAKVEAAVVEQRMLLLRSRTAPVLS
mmetsp:Transcript_125205/g.279347  ORF Transcript_125205/g.279347 Transcript_125205/m.279347 type:complete len:663 (+) Transcript_125205:32-2020(+)